MRDSLTAATRTAYGRVLSEFFAYSRSAGLALVTGEDVMRAVAAFLGGKLRDGYAAAVARQLYAALCLYWPEWVLCLRPIHRAIKGWEKSRPPVKRPPLVRPLAVAMAMRFVARGHPSMGVAVLLGFHCYLRIGELLRVEAWHIVPKRAARTGFSNPFSFVHIPKAKTGTQQDVEIQDSDVDWLVSVAVRAVGAGTGGAGDTARNHTRLFPYSDSSFRRLFAECAASYGLPRTIVPHSLRHGGATHDYAAKQLTAEQIRVRGRWKVEKSMAHYVGQMRSALATLHVPEASVQCGVELARHLRRAFCLMLKRAPPTTEVVAYRRALEALSALSAPKHGRSTGAHGPR